MVPAAERGHGADGGKRADASGRQFSHLCQGPHREPEEAARKGVPKMKKEETALKCSRCSHCSSYRPLGNSRTEFTCDHPY